MEIGDKIVCIDNSIKFNGTIINELTIDKIYTCLRLDNSWVFIKNDNGSEITYFKDRFKLLKEVRKEKLDKLGRMYEGR